MLVYYAARSKARLETVCKALQTAFDLPSFPFKSHDDWRWGRSQGDDLALKVTRAKCRTIETWMPGCPQGVSYQIILTTECEPEDFASRLAEILGCEVIRYASRNLQNGT